MEKQILDQIQALCRKILGQNLVGIYVHGSIAFGCFRWESSDIDFLIVVQEPISQREKESLIRALLALDKDCPPKGMEMSVVLAADCASFLYPTPFLLHFSNSHKERFREDISQYCAQMHGVDPDLAAHFTVIRNAGMVLWGKPIAVVFGPVPKEAYLDSIRSDIENAVEDILQDPVYIILNLCRVLAYIQEGLVLSKAQGGEWGTGHLPEQYRPLAAAAHKSYLHGDLFTAEPDIRRAFAHFMLRQIFPG